jgi:hypothetical protein
MQEIVPDVWFEVLPHTVYMVTKFSPKRFSPYVATEKGIKSASLFVR